MFESKSQALLPWSAFYWRMVNSFAITAAIISFSLGMGSWGYHALGDLPWIDALLNASMILTGMGPVDPMKTTAGKLFASFYALYSGIAFLTMVAVVTAPIFHRLMHRFHMEDEDDGPEKK